ncbi:4Fe-4S binding protein [Desulfoscipio gibsoniae]|uniref:Indolepyruvate ferredoxin oxidreductase, alpha/beta subunit n=1 Tax=Desulfoscipio gibsoniae DSM 7213 TaxID=767817 RepID=R4KLG8_9FIRM|nr:4Fe-4S binding protein [Desulfoscipio gibsoniae]AGL02422.1 indolepyruvate ferredoxin oxidreductase, alpha/beta subunit [Desulfoscipio gibsoniae DSM 7213]
MAMPARQYNSYGIHINRQWCKGCGICAALCGKKVILLDNRDKAVSVNPASCIGCGQCEIHCPELAISIHVV